MAIIDRYLPGVTSLLTSVKENKRSTILILSGTALATLALLLTTFAIPQTADAMKHGWSQIGNAFQDSGTVGTIAKCTTAAVAGILSGYILYHTVSDVHVESTTSVSEQPTTDDP